MTSNRFANSWRNRRRDLHLVLQTAQRRSLWRLPLLAACAWVVTACAGATSGNAATVLGAMASLSPLPPPATQDWLVHRVERRAGLYRGEHPDEVVLDNGLLRRSFLVRPNLACVDIQQLTSGKTLLRAIRPECLVTLDGEDYSVGGLDGQPIGNFLRRPWYSELSANPAAFQLESFEVTPTEAPFPWKRRPQWTRANPPWPAP